jgi:hypothetical protein
LPRRYENVTIHVGAASRGFTEGGRGKVGTVDRRGDGSSLGGGLPGQRAVWLAFGAGLLLATFTSAGIAGERVSAGSLGVALVANAAATLAALVVASLTARARSSDDAHSCSARSKLVVALQVVGAAVGVAVVHLALRALESGHSSALVERPAQFMNDGVAVLAILFVVWGATSEPIALARVVAGTALVLLYVATASRWHLDPMRFHGATVQQLVGLEFTGAAIGLAVFRLLARRDS